MPSVQLYLISPDKFDLTTFLPQLQAALEQGEGLVGAFLLRETMAEADIAQALLPVCSAYSVALMIENNAPLALQTGADGVHLRSVDAVKTARAASASLMIGASCGSSRDAAMRAGEAGADYVTVAPDAALIGWWQELFELPCVVENISSENAGIMAKAGADFLLLHDWEPEIAAYKAAL